MPSRAQETASLPSEKSARPDDAARVGRSDAADHALVIGLVAARHAKSSDSLARAGFRPLSIDAYGDPARPSFASTWILREGNPWFVAYGLAEAPLRDSLAAWAARGWHPVSITGAGAAPAFAALVEKDSTPTWTRLGMDREDFRRMCDSAQREKFMPIGLDAYGTSEQPRFAAVWRKNTEGIPWNYSMGDNAESLEEKAATFAAVWVRPAAVVPMPDGKLMTIWQESSVGKWSLHPALSGEAGIKSLADEAAGGLHPVSISGLPDDPGHGTFTVLTAASATPLSKTWTVTGPENPALDGFDAYMRRLMQQHQVRSGALAMVKDGRLVFAHGYTWAEADYPVTEPNSLFRVASCSKPLTSMAIHHMLRQGGAAQGPDGRKPGGQGPDDQGSLSLKEKVLAVLDPGVGSVPADTRFADITIDDLLSHSAGWIRSKDNPDPVFNDYPAGHPIRRRLPAYAKDFLSYMMGQPLQFAPGSQSSYANFGYFLLGRILETLPHGIGRSYEQAMGDIIFHPLGLTRPRFGGTLVSERLPGEVLYHTRYPYLQRGRQAGGAAWVPGAYGDFDLRNMDAAGAWILAATDYAKVLASFDLDADNPVLAPEAVRTMWAPPHDPRFLRGWFATRIRRNPATGDTLTAKWHNGLFPGTSTLVFYRPDKWSFALFLNRDIPDQLTGDVHGRELGRLADKVRNWPEEDLFPEMGIKSFALHGNPGGIGQKTLATDRDHYNTRHP